MSGMGGKQRLLYNVNFSKAAPEYQATIEDMKSFHPFLNKIRSNGWLSHGPVKVFKPHGLEITPKKWDEMIQFMIPTPKKQTVSTIKQGVYLFSFDEMLDSTDAEKSSRKAKGVTKPVAKPVSFEELMMNRGRPKSLKNATANELDVNFWDRLESWKGDDKEFAAYGNDVEGSFFGTSNEFWPFSDLEDPLQNIYNRFHPPAAGISTPMCYFGTFQSTFCMHNEDKDLYSMSYLHEGLPKMWWATDPHYDDQVHKMIQNELSVYRRKYLHNCKAAYRHKQFLFHPHIFEKYGIPLTKVVQNVGEFVILPPRSLHFGYNTGINCAEAINFATDDYLDIGLTAKTCQHVKPPFPLASLVYNLRYKDFDNYVAGRLQVMDPLDEKRGLVTVSKPVIKVNQILDNLEILANGVSSIIAGWTINRRQVVLAVIAGYKEWFSRDEIEKLRWANTNELIKMPNWYFDTERTEPVPVITDNRLSLAENESLLQPEVTASPEIVPSENAFAFLSSLVTNDTSGMGNTTNAVIKTGPTHKMDSLKRKSHRSNAIGKVIPCRGCNRNLAEYTILQHRSRHKDACYRGVRYHCTVINCQKSYKRKEELTKHIQNKHSQSSLL